VRPADLAAAVLAGGCTRVPLIGAAVAQLFGMEPLRHAQPEEATCLGAGLYATSLLRHTVTTVG
jgi:molecular chaperone HscA